MNIDIGFAKERERKEHALRYKTQEYRINFYTQKAIAFPGSWVKIHTRDNPEDHTYIIDAVMDILQLMGYSWAKNGDRVRIDR